ncbi:hypothetical protein [Motiliproteus sediminis]|uniref:hypothetical protein n=1 Tax=Motiliproteus sediminis TaxID=1468178 RepID=UPI001AEFBB4B|nr:hypothetical protein [Motiliproteus sediminis]
MRPSLCFCATGKTGLGHLRRVTNIASALRQCAPDVDLQLLTNASVEGLGDDERQLYRRIVHAERSQMASLLQPQPPSLVVVDTAVVPELEQLPSRLALILRETRADKLSDFVLPERPWDLLLLPHAADDWRPPAATIACRQQRSVGWIYRREDRTTDPLPLGAPPAAGMPQLLIAAGAGGGGDRWEAFNQALTQLIPAVRQGLSQGLEVIQVIGPRATPAEHLALADRRIQPGPRLNELFPQADLVISTMGYNSALELAASDVPVLMMAKPTTYDDQQARAARWHGRVGWAYDLHPPEAALNWLIDTLHQRRRRPPVALAESGAPVAAKALLELLQAGP